MNIKGQGHLLTLVQGHSDSAFLSFYSSETAWLIEDKFHLELSLDKRTKVYSNGPGHMTKMATMPIYGKNLNNLLLWNRKADDLETWYTASGSRVLPNLLKLWSWSDHDQDKTMDFSETIIVYDVKVMNIKAQDHPLTLAQGHSDSTFSNFFSSKTAGPIEAKFHVEPPWYMYVGMKVSAIGLLFFVT